MSDQATTATTLAEAPSRFRVPYGRAVLTVLILGGFAVLLAGFGYHQLRALLLAEAQARMVTHAQTVQKALQSFTRAGLPLDGLVGFDGLARALFAADPEMVGLAVTDADGQTVLSRWHHTTAPADLRVPAVDGRLETQGAVNLVAMPLPGRFTPAGRIVVATESAGPNRTLAGLGGAILAGLGLILAFELVRRWGLWRQGVAPPYGVDGEALLAAAAMAAVVMAGLTHAQFTSARDEARVSAEAVAARLGRAVGIGVHLEDLAGLGGMLDEQRRTDPDLGFVSLVVGNIVETSTDTTQLGHRWQPPGDHVTAAVVVQQRRVFTPHVEVVVGTPVARVWRRIAAMVEDLGLLTLGYAGVWGVLIGIGVLVRRCRPRHEGGDR